MGSRPYSQAGQCRNKSEIATNLTCPGDAKIWQFFNKDNTKRIWIDDPKLTVTCDQGISSATTTATITPTTTKNATISIGQKL